MPIVLLGLSHRTAPPEIRNRHALPGPRISEALQALRDYSAVEEAAVLATCNRLEIYADVDSYEAGVAQIKEFLTTYRDMRVEDFDKYIYTMLGAEAVEQLFRVASGIDSMLIGEPQIVGQVKEALGLAEQAGSIGSHLGRLFRFALQTGKRARSETGIDRDVVSLGAAAVELARRHCDLSATRSLVVGAGKMGAIVAKHLHANGAKSIKILNRTLPRAQSVAAPLAASADGLDSLAQSLSEADLVLSAIGSGKVLITKEMLEAATRSRQTSQKLLVIDVGVPHDVDLASSSLPAVVLYTLEDLREVIDQTMDERRGEIPAVEAIIAEQVKAYMQWYRSRSAGPLIVSLRSKAEDIRFAEIQRLFARLPELTDRQRNMVIAASVSIINQLLHAPVTKLRQSVLENADVDAAQLLEGMLDLDAFSDRLQRQLDAKTAPFLTRPKNK